MIIPLLKSIKRKKKRKKGKDFFLYLFLFYFFSEYKIEFFNLDIVNTLITFENSN